MQRLLWQSGLVILAIHASPGLTHAQTDSRNPFFAYLTDSTQRATLICYTPSELDPRNPANQRALKSSSIKADLTALRPAFDGLVLYGYHEACTPRILDLAVELKYRAVLLALWDPRSADEVDGVLSLVHQFGSKLALGVLIGNEGLTFDRYETEDLSIARHRLQAGLPADGQIPWTTSEPLVGYERPFVLEFGDFLAPNIHPVFDRTDFPPDKAAEWVHTEALRLAKATGKPVLVKETGFPHAGKPMYSPDSQRAFWSAYTKAGTIGGAGNAWTHHGVGFEAFDLPWKSEESKLEIEKSWGLFSQRREAYPAVEVWKAVKGR